MKVYREANGVALDLICLESMAKEVIQLIG